MSTRAHHVPSVSGLFDRLTRLMVQFGGALFLVVGLAWFGREIRFGWNAQSASGTIVEVRSKLSTDGLEFYPVVEFATSDERVVQFEGLAVSPPPVVGTPVEVLYPPPHPEGARINSFVQRWLLGAVFVPAGILLLTVTFGVMKTSPSLSRRINSCSVAMGAALCSLAAGETAQVKAGRIEGCAAGNLYCGDWAFTARRHDGTVRD